MNKFDHKKPNNLFPTPNCNPYICILIKLTNENILQLVKTIH